VEEAKVVARQLTESYDNTGALGDQEAFFQGDGVALYADAINQAELGRLLGADLPGGRPGLSDYLEAHLGRAGPGAYVGLLAYVEMTPAHEALLTEIRVLVRDARRVATCVGFGPRFQHSTGQAYKGGPNTGLFLQITCDDTITLPVPGHRYSFGVVKAAQARSDFEALAKRGRRALRVHIGADVGAGLEQIRAALAEALPPASSASSPVGGKDGPSR